MLQPTIENKTSQDILAASNKLNDRIFSAWGNLEKRIDQVRNQATRTDRRIEHALTKMRGLLDDSTLSIKTDTPLVVTHEGEAHRKVSVRLTSAERPTIEVAYFTGMHGPWLVTFKGDGRLFQTEEGTINYINSLI